MLYNRIL